MRCRIRTTAWVTEDTGSEQDHKSSSRSYCSMVSRALTVSPLDMDSEIEELCSAEDCPNDKPESGWYWNEARTERYCAEHGRGR